MIPWLLTASIIGRTGKKLSELVDEMIAEFPVSGEINSTVADPEAALRRVEAFCAQDTGEIDRTDGFSFATATYRLNLRQSNTEPLLRLNVETRGNRPLLAKKTAELLALIRE